MSRKGKQGINPWLGKIIPKDRIVRAIEESESMAKAAQSLHTSYNTFKKYAKKYDVWKPLPSNAGISRARKVTWSGNKPLDVEISFQKKLMFPFAQKVNYQESVTLISCKKFGIIKVLN